MQNYKKIILCIPFINISLWFLWMSIYHKHKLLGGEYALRRVLVWIANFMPWAILVVMFSIFDFWNFYIGNFYFAIFLFLFLGSCAVAIICFLDEWLLLRRLEKKNTDEKTVITEQIEE